MSSVNWDTGELLEIFRTLIEDRRRRALESTVNAEAASPHDQKRVSEIRRRKGEECSALYRASHPHPSHPPGLSPRLEGDAWRI